MATSPVYEYILEKGTVPALVKSRKPIRNITFLRGKMKILILLLTIAAGMPARSMVLERQLKEDIQLEANVAKTSGECNRNLSFWTCDYFLKQSGENPCKTRCWHNTHLIRDQFAQQNNYGCTHSFTPPWFMGGTCYCVDCCREEGDGLC